MESDIKEKCSFNERSVKRPIKVKLLGIYVRVQKVDQVAG